MRSFSRSGATAARVKPANVAGTFYPGDGETLRHEVDARLGRARTGGPAPKALIAPHAGYRYSGPVAASAYARLKPRAWEIRRIVLLGPVHYHPVRGVAVSGAEAFETPLGAVPVDAESVRRVLELPFVNRCDPAFEREHSLEVHLPFLLRMLPRFTLVPLLVGDASPAEIDTMLEALWGGPETGIVVSSDLSHFLDYESARRLDAKTSEAIVALRHEDVGHEQACGCYAVNGLLHLAKRRGLEASILDVRNSGDTAGPHDRVVGYGAYAFFEPVCDGLDAGTQDSDVPEINGLDSGMSGADGLDSEASGSQTSELMASGPKAPDVEAPDSGMSGADGLDSKASGSQTSELMASGPKAPDFEAPESRMSGADGRHSKASDSQMSDPATPDSKAPDAETLDSEARRRLLGIAMRSIRHGFAYGKKCTVDLDALPPALRGRRAAFVTLESNRRLRGCIGSLRATRPLAADVAHNAHDAAFDDPRFPALGEDEIAALHVRISVLSSHEPIHADSEADLASRLRPGIDGLVIEAGERRATFLPSVWESIPEPARFVRELTAKAGWPAGRWPDAARAWRYTTEEFD